jgi:hypothetical protein
VFCRHYGLKFLCAATQGSQSLALGFVLPLLRS